MNVSDRNVDDVVGFFLLKEPAEIEKVVIGATKGNNYDYYCCCCCYCCCRRCFLLSKKCSGALQMASDTRKPYFLFRFVFCSWCPMKRPILNTHTPFASTLSYFGWILKELCPQNIYLHFLFGSSQREFCYCCCCPLKDIKLSSFESECGVLCRHSFFHSFIYLFILFDWIFVLVFIFHSTGEFVGASDETNWSK